MATLFQITGPHPYTLPHEGPGSGPDIVVELLPLKVGKPYKSRQRARSRCKKLNDSYGRDVFVIERIAQDPDLAEHGTANEDPRFDRSEHISRSMGKPITVPDYLSEAICDDASGWERMLADWLKINDNENIAYGYSEITIGSGSWQGEITLTYFYLDVSQGDSYQNRNLGFFAVIDGNVYDCTNTTIADCGILDDTIGWYLTER